MMLPRSLPELRGVIHFSWLSVPSAFFHSGFRVYHDEMELPEEVDTFPAVCQMGLAAVDCQLSGHLKVPVATFSAFSDAAVSHTDQISSA